MLGHEWFTTFAVWPGPFAGQVRLMTTGASPISEEVFDFLRICFGATVLEGYGMTETSCVVSETQPGDATAGAVTCFHRNR